MTDVRWQYQGLYGSDDKIQACMAELGVPLAREPEFHREGFFLLTIVMVSKQYEEKERNMVKMQNKLSSFLNHLKEHMGISRSNFVLNNQISLLLHIHHSSVYGTAIIFIINLLVFFHLYE